jgi:hypothetical protein
MQKILILIFVGILVLPTIVDVSVAGEKEYIHLGKWTEVELDHIIRECARICDVGKRIDLLSAQFLNLEYQDSTLIGDMNTPEVFVIDLRGVDCFTYIDYVEAMRRSACFSEFKENLKKVRYQLGKVDFIKRNHFFTDWREFNPGHIEDVTKQIGNGKTKSIVKRLNKKEGGAYFLPGISPREQEVHYIPCDAIDDDLLGKLRTGDYVGIYTERKGLDVSHTGIIIKKRDEIYLRHASSIKTLRKVVDQDLRKYISKKPGLVVLRPKEKIRSPSP